MLSIDITRYFTFWVYMIPIDVALKGSQDHETSLSLDPTLENSKPRDLLLGPKPIYKDYRYRK